MATNVLGDTRFTGTVVFGDAATMGVMPANTITNAAVSATADIARSKLEQNALAEFQIPFTDLRVHDALHTVLPGTAASDDLGLVGGAHGTDAPMVQAGDLKAAGTVTRYARFLWGLPPEYDNDETVQVRVTCGMQTTVADTSCTVDVTAFLVDKDGTLNGAPTDLCTTDSQSMNSVTAASKDFTLTDSSLISGSLLDVGITIVCTDAATGTAVTPSIYAIALLADIRG